MSFLLRLTGHWLALAGVLADREPQVRAAFDPHLTLAWRDVAEAPWIALSYTRRE